MTEPSQTFPSSAQQHILPGARNPVIVHPVFNNVGGNFNQNLYSISSNPLWEAIADVGASHDSEIQVERGRCSPGTRESVLKILHEWKRLGSDGSPVCWVSGTAGVGKSAIALTFASGIAAWVLWSITQSPKIKFILDHDLPKSDPLDLLSSAEFCPCSSFGDEVDYFQVGTDRYYQVNLQPHYFEIMKALLDSLNDLDDPEKMDIFWNLLHPWLVTLCHPQPKVLSVYRTALIAAERWGQHYDRIDAQPPPWLIDDSKRLQRKILLWLDSFPPEYTTRVTQVKEIIDSSRIYWSSEGLYIRDEPLDQWLNGF